ncbi:MAG: hypothetical protein ABSA72_02765 [Nitrososphaerales archaeon]
MISRRFCGVLAGLILVVILASALSVGTVSAAPTTITAYKSTIAVKVTSTYQPSQWTDTQTTTDPSSGITFGAKQNGTGWLYFMSWQTSTAVCSDNFCFGGIELDTLSNTGEMGSPTTPSLMILASPSFQGMVGHAADEFISTADETPSSVESLGYTTQSVCGALTFTGATYTVQCYRQFTLTKADPHDPTASMTVGSTVEIGFAVGEFNSPGQHEATAMNSYTLTFSGSTYSSSSSTTSTTSTTTSPTTSSTTSTTTSTTSKTTSSTTSTTSTTTSPTTSSTTSTTTSVTSSTASGSGYTISVATNATSYLNSHAGTITATITPGPATKAEVQFQITNPYGTIVFNASESVATGGKAIATFTTGGNPGSFYWVGGPYSVTASWTPSGATTALVAVARFTYSGPSAATTSTTTASTQTVTTTAPATTQTVTNTATLTSTLSVTGPATTVTNTATSTETSTSISTTTAPPSTVTTTSTVTQTTSSIPSWAYGLMVVLLLLGLAIGYVVKRPSIKQG